MTWIFEPEVKKEEEIKEEPKEYIMEDKGWVYIKFINRKPKDKMENDE